jgi:hypothetical protein
VYVPSRRKRKRKNKRKKETRVSQKEKEKGDQLNVPAKSDTVEMQNSLSLPKETKSSTSPIRLGGRNRRNDLTTSLREPSL